MPKIILSGDTTDQGGHVVVDPGRRFTLDGRAIALVGDTVTCHSHCTIAQGDATHTLDGVPVAYEGHKTTCGAVLVASAGNFTKEGA